MRDDVANRLKKSKNQVETTPLWHGTNEYAVSKIATRKFDRALSGKNGKPFYKFVCSLFIFINIITRKKND